MGKIKIDLRDRRILNILDYDANINTSRLAKKIGVSRQVIEYRINKLLSQKTIYTFYSLIDVGRLGYSSFRVHIKLKNVNEKTYSAFASELFTEYPAFWVAFISGSFDLIIDFFAKNANDFENIFSILVEKNKEIIQSYEVLVILEMSLFSYNYFLEGDSERVKVILHRNIATESIDDIDKKILLIIKNNSRTPYELIGSKVGLTRNAVKNRIRKLEEKKVIVGYKAFIDFHHFGKHSFKIFIKYNNSKIEQEKSLLTFLEQKAGVLAYLKLLGKWNLDVELHTKDIKELQQFIITLRNKYDIIEDYEIIQLIEDYGIDFYPNKL